MNIRIMTAADYDEVYSLWTSTPGMGLNNVDDSREGIARYLARNPNTSFVAEEGGRIIGAILAGHDGRRGLIHHTVVAEDMQRKGIGKSLLNSVIEALKGENIHKVALLVFCENEKGNDFWEKCGFSKRTDIIYRNKLITELIRYDT